MMMRVSDVRGESFGWAGARVSWRSLLVMPSKPGDLGGALRTRRISFEVIGVMSPVQVSDGRFLQFHLYALENHVGWGVGIGCGFRSIFDASETKVAFSCWGSDVLVLVSGSKMTDVSPLDLELRWMNWL